jgi:1-acyl-sn-glycerol-3-phosphate acyltransferase
MRTVDRVARAIAHLFYRVDAVGHIPSAGPLLLLPNHPNALLDPAIVMATAGRPVRFLAKSTLFRTPLRPLLNSADAIPVYRKQDEGSNTSKNRETFEAVDVALARGEVVCLFPEGISHSTGKLEPLRTGAARMALSAAARGVPVLLVPVGINPEQKTDFRSRMTVVYGRPFPVAPESTVPSLTAEIADRMRHLIVEADPDADAALVQRIERLYSSERRVDTDAGGTVERRRAIAAGMHRLRDSNPEWYETALLQLRRYDDRLRRFGLRDRALDVEPTASDAWRFVVRELPRALVLVPVAALAIAVFAVPYLLTAGVARLSRETDVTATTKVVAGTVLYLLWVVLLAWMAARSFGTPAGVAAAMLSPILAVAGMLAIERESAAWRTARAWLSLRGTHPDTRKRLRRHRAELADVLDSLYEALQRDRVEGRPQP